MSIVKQRRTSNNGVLIKNVDVYVENEKIGQSAIKKEKIVGTILSEENQLNLIAGLLEEYLKSVNYESDLFTYAKSEFGKIKAVLSK